MGLCMLGLSQVIVGDAALDTDEFEPQALDKAAPKGMCFTAPGSVTRADKLADQAAQENRPHSADMDLSAEAKNTANDLLTIADGQHFPFGADLKMYAARTRDGLQRIGASGSIEMDAPIHRRAVGAVGVDAHAQGVMVATEPVMLSAFATLAKARTITPPDRRRPDAKVVLV